MAPPELFQSLRLVSRSPALAVGTGVDKAIDGGIAEGIKGDVAPAPPPNPPPAAPLGQPQPDVAMNQRRVPIDAIPLAMLAMPPVIRRLDQAHPALRQTVGFRKATTCFNTR